MKEFWKAHPALLFGLTILLGASSALFWEEPWNWLFPLLWSLYLLILQKPLQILALAASALYSWALYFDSPLLPEPKSVSGLFEIASIEPHHSPFQRGVRYKGALHLQAHSLPCLVYSHKEEVKAATWSYWVRGELIQQGRYAYILKPKEWIPHEKRWTLAELRFKAKEKLRRFFKRHLPASHSFLSALATGDVEERLLRYQFGRLGLQHILAISGFHFAILIAFCSRALGLFLPKAPKLFALLALVSLYYLFIGSLPAVERSYLTALFYLAARLFGKEASGLNLLGCALGFEVVLNPLVCEQLGFQLSFLSCAGILLLHPAFEKKIELFLPKRNSLDKLKLGRFAQHGYLLSSFLRKAISLGLAVNLSILPLLLYHFHQFPLWSLFYNLFFPYLVSLSLFFLLLASLFYLLNPLLGSLFFFLTDYGSSKWLDLAHFPPPLLEYNILCSSIPAWTIPIYLFCLFSFFLHEFKNRITSII
jgi:competence protein ComEC